MRLITVLIPFFLFACAPKEISKIESSSDTLVIEGMNILTTYPQLKSETVDSSVILHFNDVLKNRAGINYDLNDQKLTENTQSIEANYKVLYENDTLMSIEYYKKILTKSGETSLKYYPLMVNLKLPSFYIFAEAIWLDFDRSKLLPAIKNHLKNNPDHHINLDAYQAGSMQVISFNLMQDSLIVYPGSEGEFYGKYRVSVPLSVLNLN